MIFDVFRGYRNEVLGYNLFTRSAFRTLLIPMVKSFAIYLTVNVSKYASASLLQSVYRELLLQRVLWLWHSLMNTWRHVNKRNKFIWRPGLKMLIWTSNVYLVYFFYPLENHPYLQSQPRRSLLISNHVFPL